MYCKNCGYRLDSASSICPSCATQVGGGTSFCQNCGEVADPNFINCASCGAPLRQVYSSYSYNNTSYNSTGTPMQKSRMVAGLLGIFLGGFGVHNFYLGFTTKAVIQLILTLFSCGLAGIWGLIEGILILTRTLNVDANNVPLSDD